MSEVLIDKSERISNPRTDDHMKTQFEKYQLIKDATRLFLIGALLVAGGFAWGVVLGIVTR